VSWDTKLFQRHLSTRRFGRELVWFEEIDSTNHWLADNTGQFTMSGGVAIADHQTRGRGRHERAWFDEPGASLLFSVVLHHPASDTCTGLLSLIPAIALTETLFAHWGEQVRMSVKWPNDVQLNGRKVAGILGQTALQGGQAVSVVGVGVNVLVRAESLPDELRGMATSIYAETGELITREALLAEILASWESLFDLFLAGRHAELRERWERFGPAKEAWLTRREGEQMMSGHFLGLGVSGQLLLRDEAGQTREIFTGDIEQ
jgi:BirA family transcriptional regulator, biotin operon repressor / biotin---[acetyl-CoA-carboxylase] ligase